MIKLGSPYIGDEEIAAVIEVLKSGSLVQGLKVKNFEDDIATYLGVKHVFAVSSGTAALHIAAMALDILPGDVIIVPDYTYPATANVFEQLGAIVKLVDIDIATLQIDVDKIEGEIDERTKAIVPVHQFGNVASMDKVVELANRYNLRVIEDAACALGAEFNGTKVGTIGDIGCFSLHPRKSITTGEGGIIATNDDVLAEKISLLRNHGVSYIEGKMSFGTWGLNYRLTEMQAAMGICQLKRLDEINKKNNELAQHYNKLLRNCNEIALISENDNSTRVNQTYFILCNSSTLREELKNILNRHEIEVSIGSHALHCQPYFKNKYGNENHIKFKNADIAYLNGIALPLHMKMDISDVDAVCRIILQYLEGKV